MMLWGDEMGQKFKILAVPANLFHPVQIALVRNQDAYEK